MPHAPALRRAHGLLAALTALLLSALAACGPAPQQAQAESLEADSALAAEAAAVERVVYALPSAPQVLALLKQAGATYDPRAVHDPAQASRYTSTEKAALNIGLYSTDLAVASTFGQSQAALDYFVATQRLADRLGVASAFDQSVVARLDRNRNRADSVNAIVTRAYDAANRKLHSFGQADVGRLILVGGWTEGLYLATRFHSAKPSPTIAERIAEQKLVLEHLMAIIAQDSARSTFQLVYPRLRQLQQAFAPVAIDYSYQGVSTDAARKLTRVDNRSQVRMSPEQLATITRQVAELRAAIVQ